MLDAATAVDLCRATLMAAVVIAAPMLLVGMAAGLLVGLDASAHSDPRSDGCFRPENPGDGGGVDRLFAVAGDADGRVYASRVRERGLALMESLAQWLVDHLVLGVLVMTRLSTLLMAMPAVGVGVPKRVRAFLALLLTILLLAAGRRVARAVDSLPQIDNLIELAIAIAREGLIGLLIGATIQLIITGLQLGGEAITSTGGMQLGDAVDPTTSSSMPSVARLVGLLVTAVMLIVGGHRILLGVLLDSFEATSRRSGAVSTIR